MPEHQDPAAGDDAKSIPAIATHQTVTIPKRESLLLISILANDRQKPSRDRARRRSAVLDALAAAHGEESCEAVLDKAQGIDPESELTPAELQRAYAEGAVEATLTRETMDGIVDFTNEALERKDKESGEAIVTGLQALRLLNLVDRIEAARGPRSK